MPTVRGEWGDIPLAYTKSQTPTYPSGFGSASVGAQLEAQIAKAAAANNDAVVAVMKEVRDYLRQREEESQ